MRKNHICGITPAGGAFGKSEENRRLMHLAGVNCARMHLSFPFDTADAETPSAAYRADLDAMRAAKADGIEPFATFQCAGTNRYNPATGTVGYNRTIPLWMGAYEDDAFYANVEKVAAFMAADTRGTVTWWQVANEPDIDSFIGIFTHEQNERYLLAIARGLKAGNPDAKIGINLAGVGVMGGGDGTLGMHPYAMRLMEKVYSSGLFDYLGLDGYFGSWSGGNPEDWKAYIDEAYAACGLPILISEWGYSTIQRGEPRTAEDKDRNFNSIVCREKDWDAGGGAKWQGIDHCEALQGDYIRICMKIFAEHPAVIGNLFFQWQDQARCWQCGAPDCPAECGWGVIRTDGTPKSGYFALAEANAVYFG